MYSILDAHFLSIVIIVGSIMVTPIYVMATYVYHRDRDCRLFECFFFGFTSSDGSPLQLFFPAVTNRLILFPTGMIPLFLIPYAIFFHVLSWLNYLKFQRSG